MFIKKDTSLKLFYHQNVKNLVFVFDYFTFILILKKHQKYQSGIDFYRLIFLQKVVKQNVPESTFYYDRISTVFVNDDWCIVYVFHDGFTKFLDYFGLFCNKDIVLTAGII